MSLLTPQPQAQIIYPESDGQPLGENTLQFQWIVTITCGLEAIFRHEVNVFIAGDLFWYPVEGRPDIVTAPDTLLVFGRPKGHRRSYKQWEEAGIAPQVVIEVMSPSNRRAELASKFRFYDDHGVEEYYLYDPDHTTLNGWLRGASGLQPIPRMNGWISPRLRVRFEFTEETLNLYGPDGQRFLTHLELVDKAERDQIDRQQAQRDKEQAQRDKEQAQRDKERLAAQLRALGIEPEA